MKQTILIIALIGLISSCTINDKKTNRFIQNITLGQNIDIREYDEKTGWTRILLKKPHNWGYIDKDSNVVIPFIYEFLNPFDLAGMAVGQLGEKHGFINIKGETVVPFIYDDLGVFSEGLAPAKKNGKYGYINRKGEVVIPFQFDKERYFYKTGLSEASKDGKWGFINKKGEEVVPIKYSEVDCHKMEEELIFVCSKNKWAIFDKNGNQRTDFIYDEIYGTSNNFDYFAEEYLYKGLLLARKGNQYQYLNQDLKIVADFGYYTKAEPITKFGFAIVKKEDLYGVINSKNKIVVPFIYPFIEHPKRSYQGFYDEYYIYKNGKIGILNEKAVLITDVIYDSFERDYCKISDSSQVIFIAKRDNHLGIINKSGEIILPIEYEEIGLFMGSDISMAKKNGLFGIIDSYGNIKLPFEYENITSYKDWDYFILQKGKDYGVIDKQNLKMIFPTEYQAMEQCFYDKNKFIVKKNGYYGIITRKNEITIPMEYDEISNWVEYGPDEHFVVKNGKHGLISREGKTVIPPIYDQIFVDNEVLIKVKNNGLYGTINWKNKIVHPIQYEQILWEWPYLTGRPIDTIYVKKSGKYFATDTNGKVILETVSEKIIDDKFGYLLKNNDLIIDK
jgi:hypothetical protein